MWRIDHGVCSRTRVMTGRPIRFSCQVRESWGLDQNNHAGDELAEEATCEGLCPLLLEVSWKGGKSGMLPMSQVWTTWYGKFCYRQHSTLYET